VNDALAAIRSYFRSLGEAWNRFWFDPSDPATLAAIRVCAGAMLCYTHLVWSLDLQAFFGQQGWMPVASVEPLREGTYVWSWFFWIDSPAVLWTVHIAAMVVFFLLTIGFCSRIMAVLAYLAAVSYVHRIAPGAFFGLDKINCMLALYLILGPSGACFSVDRWLRRRRLGADTPPVAPSVGANVAIRMMQLHMCVIYLFGALGKLQGVHWWDGQAMWMSAANLEYQSLDLTWLAAYPRLSAFVTHVTVFWELFYCTLIWPRLTRPIMLALAVAVHGGIALALGMITFGLAMLIGNMAFVPPQVIRAVVETLSLRGGGRGWTERSAGSPGTPDDSM